MDRKIKNLIHIKYWPSWIVAGILWLIVNLLSQSMRMKLGELISPILTKVMPYRLKISETNIYKCFKDSPQHDADKIFELHKKEFGKSFMEFTAGCFLRKSGFKRIANFIGKEHIDNALSKEKGILILGMHTMSIEMGTPIFSQKYHIDALFYRPISNPVFDYLTYRSRLRSTDKMIPKNNIRQLTKLLKDKKVVWYAADQDFGKNTKNTIFSPFFGVQANTLVLYAKIAQMTDCIVIPIGMVRSRDDKSYNVICLPELAPKDYETEEKAALAMNQSIEKLLKNHEEQYYWVHRRFKTRPEGEMPFYPSKPRKPKKIKK